MPAHFEYENYCDSVVPAYVVAKDAWKIIYRELLFYTHRLPHIIDANELKKETWGARVRKFEVAVAKQFKVAPEVLESAVGKLYTAHERKAGERVQVQNVVGTGFENLLAVLLRRLGPSGLEAKVKALWTELPGYGDGVRMLPGKPVRPDISIIRNGDTTVLLLPKWSIRHDRLENAKTEAQKLRNSKMGKKPHVYMVTNEFAPGRLVAVLSGGDIELLFHVNLDLLLQVMDDHESLPNLQELVKNGQLKDLSRMFAEV